MPRSYQQGYTPKSKKTNKKKQNNPIFQAIGMILVALGLAWAFFVYVIPASIEFAFDLLGTETSFTPSDTIPPQVPILSAPPEAVSESSLSLEGFGEPESLVILVVNNQALPEQQIATDGTFTYQLELQAGENTIAAYSRDQAGNESNLSREFTTSFDNQAPELEITEPTDGQTIQTLRNQTISVTGITEPDATVYLNGRRTKANQDGEFKLSFQLNEGSNELVFKAEDAAGNSMEKTITVNFEI